MSTFECEAMLKLLAKIVNYPPITGITSLSSISFVNIDYTSKNVQVIIRTNIYSIEYVEIKFSSIASMNTHVLSVELADRKVRPK